jgi:outer membrane lipopolysaccharide assembly protein LptE/RlpB
MKLSLTHTGIVTVTFLFFFLFTGCGYKMVGKETHLPPDVRSIAIPTFTNRTFEPGIEVPFTQAFLKEFIRDKRVKVLGRAEADALLEGVIKSFYIYSISYDRSGYALEYRINILIDLTLKKQNGEVIWSEKNFMETLSYLASSDVVISEANKSDAIQKIGRLIAERIRNRFFYNF